MPRMRCEATQTATALMSTRTMSLTSGCWSSWLQLERFMRKGGLRLISAGRVELAHQVCHLDGIYGRLVPLVARFHTRAIERLLDRIGGEYPKDHRHPGLIARS